MSKCSKYTAHFCRMSFISLFFLALVGKPSTMQRDGVSSVAEAGLERLSIRTGHVTLLFFFFLAVNIGSRVL